VEVRTTVPPPMLWLVKLLVRTGLARHIPQIQRQTTGLTASLKYYSDAVLAGPGEQLMGLEDLYEKVAKKAANSTDGSAIDLFLGDPKFRHFRPAELAELADTDPGYPPTFGMSELRALVAAKLRREDQLDYDPTKEVIITAGASQAITAAIQAFVNPGDKVVLFDPTYLFYYYALRLQRARIHWVPTTMAAHGLPFDQANLERAMRGARMVFVNSPSNPTGAVLSPAALEVIVNLARRHDVLIFSDEVYRRFVYDVPFTATASLPQARERTLTVGSLSKGHGMAGYRVGWLAAPPNLMRPLQMHHAISSIYVPTICQRLALTALNEGAQEAVDLLADYQARRQMVREGLQQLPITVTPPSGAFYFWLPVARWGLDGMAFAERLMHEEGVLVMPGNFCGPSGHAYVRLAFTAKIPQLRSGIARLAAFMARLEQGP